MGGPGEKPKLIINGKRTDGRAADELRPIKMKVRVLNEANGSAFVQWGNNKVLAAVMGPQECIPKHEASPYRAIIKCRYSMAPFCSLEEHGRSGPSRRSKELSKVIREVFENLIIAEAYPNTEINIFIDILQSDGGTRCASIVAAALALADAGIPMKDLVTAVAVGKAGDEMVVDLNKDEDNNGESDMPIAIAPRNGDILLYQMDGVLSKEQVARALELAFAASKKVHELQAEALRQVYDNEQEKVSLEM